jgi:putative ABC transport system permease protein
MFLLARRLLFHELVRFAVAAAGVSVSVMLVLVQVGLYFGFMQSASLLADHSTADAWVTLEGFDNFEAPTPMDERLALRVDETPGVARTERVLVAFAPFKVDDGGNAQVQVVGLQPGGTLLRPWSLVAGDVTRLAETGAIVVDRGARDKLHLEAVGERTELSGVMATAVAMTDGIRSLSNVPFVFTNLASARAFIGTGDRAISFILVAAEPGVDARDLRRRLDELPNLRAFTRDEMSRHVRTYWADRTGFGAAIFFNALLGIVVGLVVVGQILYSGTVEHLREFGTLKAMGGTNALLVKTILYQAMISAAVGFVVGSGLAVIVARALEASHLTVVLSPLLLVGTAFFAVVMCAGAGLLAVLKALRVDPGIVFRG